MVTDVPNLNPIPEVTKDITPLDRPHRSACLAVTVENGYCDYPGTEAK